MKRFTSLILVLITIFLSFPMLATKTDAAFTGEDKVTIVLDPGHGGANVGTSARGVGEKTYTMKLATLIYNKLMANGSFNVYMTRNGDYDLELYQRAEVANSYNADLLISIHFDGNPVSSMNGVTTYTSVFDEYASVSLSQSIAQKIASATGLKNNGVKRRSDNQGYYWNSDKQWDCQDPSLGVLSDYYGIPTWAAKFGMKSIIVEHGFFSNAHDVNILFADGTLEKMAQAEADAIISYYTNHTHNYSTVISRDFPSNCVYTGKQSTRCLTCGHRKNITNLAPATDNHYWITKSSTPASCGTDGKVVRECRITQNLVDKGWTGEIHTQTTITPAPTDHTMALAKEVPATHTVDGYKTWKCKTCSYSFKDILKAEGHTYEFVGYTAPSCEKSGGNTYKCTVCSSSYTDKEPALGHSFSVIDKKEPTCIQKGSTLKRCSVCSHEETDYTDPLGHSLPEGGILEPTCTDDGYEKGNCIRCSEKIDNVLPKNGHTLTVTKEEIATCEKKGIKEFACSKCDYTEKEITEPAGHSFTEEIIEKATCEKAGKAILTCSVCSYTKEEKTEKTGHEKSKNATVKEEATLFKDGIAEYPCKNNCNKVFTESIPKTLTRKAEIIALAVSAIIISAAFALILILIIKKSKKDESMAIPVAEESPEKEDIEIKEEEAIKEESQADAEVKAE